MLCSMVIDVSDYTRTLGGRFKCDGDFSGEWFREDVLIPAIKEILDYNNKQKPFDYNNIDLKNLTIDFSNLYGIPECFLDEAFGRLAYEYFEMTDEMFNFPLNNVNIICNEDDELAGKIKNIIKDSSYYFLYNFWTFNRK